MTPGAERPGAGDDQTRPPHAASSNRDQDTRFRTTLTRVLLVQVVTLVILWLLQATYHP